MNPKEKTTISGAKAKVLTIAAVTAFALGVAPAVIGDN
jgi:hypothetical protein